MNSKKSALRLEFLNRKVIFIGALFMLMGLFGLWSASRAGVSLTCDRNSDECTYESTVVGSTTEETLAIADLKEAEVKGGGDDDDSDNYLALLHTEEGTRDLTLDSEHSRDRPDRIVQEVNRFLETPEQSHLEVDHSIGAVPMLLILLFTAFGAHTLLLRRNAVKVEALPENGQLLLERRRWWQSGGQEKRLPLDQIESIDVQDSSSRTSTRPGRSRRTHRTVIRLKSGETTPLFSSYTSGKGPFRRAEQLRELLERARKEAG